MENASKALLIAGGILLAMMIIALLVIVINAVSDFSDSQDRQTQAEELEEFNKGFLAYNKQKMYGTDIITVINKALDNNKTYADDKNMGIEIEVIIKEIDDEDDSLQGSYSLEELEKKLDNLVKSSTFKSSIFECTGVNYSAESGYEGRISKMTFSQI